MTATTNTVNFDRFLPEGQSLFDFQQVGVAYALYQSRDGKGVLFADEQGLGKTRQFITTAKVWAAIHKVAPKILFVCKSALRGNLLRELAICAPEWDAQILGGSRPFEVTNTVAIISFNLLRVWADSLVQDGFNILVIDESHNVKDPKTQQTKAALKVADNVRKRQGLVLLATGTPILNRPVELVSQLQLIGRLRDVAPKPRRGDTDKDWEYSFKFTFCGAEHNGHGWEFKKSSNLDLLNTRARGNFMVRRLRDEVLDLSETHRQSWELSLNGDLDPYWKVEREFQAKDPRSYWIELYGALRQAVALCKIDAAVEWVKDFVEENEGKKLVVWAWHIPTQVEVARALNAAGIETVLLRDGAGDPKKIEAIKARFNEGSAQVIVCSLRAHAEGHTLVGDGHNVTDSLFLEQPWHPGNVRQAEDRINRIGREAAAVFAHTLLVPGTVDDDVAELIAEKWETSKAAIDGTEVEAQTIDIQRAAILKLQARMAAKYPGRVFPGLEGDQVIEDVVTD